eukprot:IDg2462t1
MPQVRWKPRKQLICELDRRNFTGASRPAATSWTPARTQRRVRAQEPRSHAASRLRAHAQPQRAGHSQRTHQARCYSRGRCTCARGGARGACSLAGGAAPRRAEPRWRAAARCRREGRPLCACVCASARPGKEGARCHREVLHDSIRVITKPAIRRLARRRGVKRISDHIYEETRNVLRCSSRASSAMR